MLNRKFTTFNSRTNHSRDVGNKQKMRKHIFILSILSFLISIKSFACDCKEKSLKELQDIEFENSECIFIGEVLTFDLENNTFEIKVTESFNGDKVGKIYNGIYNEYCGSVVDEIGKWIIYANPYNESIIEINACGISRSFENPQKNIQALKPPVPPKLNQKIANYNKLKAERKVKAKSDLKEEISYLRLRINK